MYIERTIDSALNEWKESSNHKPILLKGARQVGKSTAVQHLGNHFENFVEINFEKKPIYRTVFEKDKDVRRIVSEISAISGKKIIPGRTLLFLDEIQCCPEAIMSLRYFKEDMPEMHVIGAGSLLQFTLDEIATYGVGRIHSLNMYPFSFDEFLKADGNELLLKTRDKNPYGSPFPEAIHQKLVSLFRIYLLVGGMPEAVSTWVNTHDFLESQKMQEDIIQGYINDFPKYGKKADPVLLERTLKSVATQMGTNKFSPTKVGDYKKKDVEKALGQLTKSGIIIPVTHSDGNGLPLGSQIDENSRKYLLIDSGLMLRLQNMELSNNESMTELILAGTARELVNKGNVTEMVTGLEILKNSSPETKKELFYWLRQEHNRTAEVDYLTVSDSRILPMEVKSDTQGGMKSLWYFMEMKKLKKAIRISLENIAKLQGPNNEEVIICPLYYISGLNQLEQCLQSNIENEKEKSSDEIEIKERISEKYKNAEIVFLQAKDIRTGNKKTGKLYHFTVNDKKKTCIFDVETKDLCVCDGFAQKGGFHLHLPWKTLDGKPAAFNNTRVVAMIHKNLLRQI